MSPGGQSQFKNFWFLLSEHALIICKESGIMANQKWFITGASGGLGLALTEKIGRAHV